MLCDYVDGTVVCRGYSLCDFVSFSLTQKREDEKDGERKGIELGGTCERGEIKANNGKIRKRWLSLSK